MTGRLDMHVTDHPVLLHGLPMRGRYEPQPVMAVPRRSETTRQGRIACSSSMAAADGGSAGQWQAPSGAAKGFGNKTMEEFNFFFSQGRGAVNH